MWWTTTAMRRLGAERFRHQIGDVEVAGYRLGPPDGEPWILLHGLGATSVAWYPVLAELSRECRVIVPELSSLGGSRCPNHGLNVLEGTEIARSLIDLELGGSATVAGISLGGWMGTRLALQSRDRVERLLIIDGGGYLDQDWDRIEETVTVESIDDIGPLYGALFHRVPWPLRLSRQAFYAAYRSRAVRHVLETTEEAHAFSDDDLRTLDLPVGIIWGEHDRLFELRVGEAIHAALPDSELRVIEDSGHAVHWERPDELVRAMQDLRARLSRVSPDPT